MNSTENILTVLIEENGEVVKEACKALRFGIDSEFEGETNRESINREFIDLLGTYQLGVKMGVFDDLGLDLLPDWVYKEMENKMEKIKFYREFSEKL